MRAVESLECITGVGKVADCACGYCSCIKEFDKVLGKMQKTCSSKEVLEAMTEHWMQVMVANVGELGVMGTLANMQGMIVNRLAIKVRGEAGVSVLN